ncbi:hypothetical protein [Chromohalobacter sp.]|uniref:hypothetical protein n=1 Tax=Chromohalobacter sp. TaxID=50740 RepID=UPI001D533D23|nr:hypothetical protein [Chromohalobacter sp.]NQY46254.1 hypothetical protein [Chromohalobacter sp.]
MNDPLPTGGVLKIRIRRGFYESPFALASALRGLWGYKAHLTRETGRKKHVKRRNGDIDEQFLATRMQRTRIDRDRQQRDEGETNEAR